MARKPLRKRAETAYWLLHDAVQLSVYKKIFVKHCSVNKKVILFESMLGRSYSCNPKAIYEKMLEEGLDKEYKIYWIKDRGMKFEVPGNVTYLTKNSFRYHYMLCKARIWVFNTRQPEYIVKRPETEYIMTWHGTPLKLLALDMEDVQMAGNKGIESYKANFWRQSRRWDYLIAPNQYSSDIFRRCFDFKKNMLEIGYPRNDTLVNNNNPEYISKLKKKFKLPEDKKIILYAPTWRDNESLGKGKYIFNPHINFDKLYRNLKDEYVFIVKYHYLIAEALDFSRFKGFIYSIDTDISDLYLVSDMHMTDYSSTMFDYAILRRPLIFYTYDLEEYYRDRGVYFDFEADAPGPFIFDTDQLIELLQGHPDFAEYKDKYDAFCEKFNHWDDGKASEKMLELITSFR